MGIRTDYDVVVVGSGFGGSTAALRLTEKGYRVGVLEAGRRFDESTLPKTSLAAAAVPVGAAPRLHGIQRITLLKDVMVLSGAGVGGGSLIYANTLYEPLGAVLRRPAVGPHHRLAGRAGAVLRPGQAHARRRRRTRRHAVRRGDAGGRRGDGRGRHVPTRRRSGVFFGEPGVEVADPYFGGAGPRRGGCIECGECMTGLPPRRQEHAPDRTTCTWPSRPAPRSTR